MSNPEPSAPTDAQIRGLIVEWWKNQFRNWGGDALNECVNELAIEDDEDSEVQIYDRACVLLDGAEVQLTWADPDAEVEVPEWAKDDE